MDGRARSPDTGLIGQLNRSLEAGKLKTGTNALEVRSSHTAVVVGAAEEQLGTLRVRASEQQTQQLLAWSAAWPERTWAVEGAGGLGHMLAQQLAAAGERVLDVQPKLAARVRLLASRDTNKNDPNDARSVAIAALRSPACRGVRADDHAAVLKVRAERHRDLGRLRTRSPAGCTRSYASWPLAGSGRRSPQLTRPVFWRRPNRPGPLPSPAGSSPATSWKTCAALTTRWARPRRDSRRR
jgi:Transposase